MMNKRLKQGTTFLLALALAFPLLTLPGARAANAIETDRKCSVSFSVSGEGNELADAGTDIKVNLYKVADVDVSGNYTATGAFTELDVSSVRADNNDAASKWAARAKEAQKLLKNSVKPTTTVTLAAGTGSLADLATGLYLVDTPEVVTTNYTYTFTPYLVSLPTNNYYSNGNDTWIYDLTDTNAIGLKPEGTLVASKIADRVGITRSVIVNALRKFESAGVIESRSSGMKGTYIKVVNDYVFKELDKIKKEKMN